MGESLPVTLEDVVAATQAAGAAIMGYFRSAYAVTDKTPDNPVTDADLAADALLRRQLMALLPESGWLSEESVDRPERLTCRDVWVVDPLDGTKEFVLGLPEFAVSVGLVRDGRPLLGVVYNPAAGELFAGVRDQGVTCNGRPVQVSSRRTLGGSHVDASRSERRRGEFAPFESEFQIVTRGSIAYKLARVAAGLTDATWSRGPKSEWDICAGALLIEAAGGRCVDLSGRPLLFNRPRPKVNGVIGDNGLVHDDLMALLGSHGPARVR